VYSAYTQYRGLRRTLSFVVSSLYLHKSVHKICKVNRTSATKLTQSFSSIVWLNYLILLTIRRERLAFSSVSFGWFWKEPAAYWRCWKELVWYSSCL